VIVVVADHGGRVERAGEAESKKALPSAATTRRHLLQVDAAQTSQSGGSRRRSISLSRSSGTSWMLAAAGALFFAGAFNS
jgi:hypothetical protein